MRNILAACLVLVSGVAFGQTARYVALQERNLAQASAARIPLSQAASTSHRADAVNQGGVALYISRGDQFVAQGDADKILADAVMSQAAALEAQAMAASGVQAENLWKQAAGKYGQAWSDYKKVNQRYYQDAVHWYTCAVRPALATGP